MDEYTEENSSKTEKGKTQKGKKSKKLFRRKSLRSVGSFVNRILKTLSTLAHFGDLERTDVEDDDGGFKDVPGTHSVGAKERGLDEPQLGGCSSGEVTNTVKSLTLSSQGSLRNNLSWCFGDKTPGVQGLKNHGNTCFMNAVVQCLSNTDLFAEFLGLELYTSDHPVVIDHSTTGNINGSMNVNLGAASDESVITTKGEVTTNLASLVRALWTLDYSPQLSVEFKNTVSKYSAQFRGNSQHDALEFLLWLLNRVNEDLDASPNKKTKTPGKPPVGESPGAALSSSPPSQTGSHSFVQAHFQAQYKSSLTCPNCLKQSNTFDPFLCISLPIPLRQTRCLTITLVFQSKTQRYLRTGLAVPLFGTIAVLREMLAQEGNITADQVILAELYSDGFQRSFFDEDDMNVIAEGDNVYAFQTLPPHGTGGSTLRSSGYHRSLPSSPYSSGSDSHRLPATGTLSSEYLSRGGSEKILILFCNTSGTGQQTSRFGPPFLMREERAMSWDQLQQCILNKMCYLMRTDAQIQNPGILFHIRVVGGPSTSNYLSPQDSRPLYHPSIIRALQFCRPGGPPHVKLVIEWEQQTKERIFGNIQEEVIQDAESIRLQQQAHQLQHSCTLDECFQLYTKEEQLAPDDAWKCPHCKKLQQGMVKLSLWTLPDILILHLKRFRQVGERRNKLSTVVKFPVSGLDMTPHVVKRSQSSRNLKNQWSSRKQPFQSECNPGQCLYDLYAVCNHHGSMQGGHYTAYCRNSVDGQWYSYDDSSVEVIPEGEVCTRAAYILFYQRRNAIPQWSANSSVKGSTSSSVSDHWLVRLSGDSKRGSLVSRSSTNCTSVPESPDSPVFHDGPLRDEKGGFDTRPFVRGIQGRSVSMKSPTSKAKEAVAKALPLRWSFGSRERSHAKSGELVEYLESGRRPRCTNEPIVPLMTTSTNTDDISHRIKKTSAVASRKSSGSQTNLYENPNKTVSSAEKIGTLKRNGNPKDGVSLQQRTTRHLDHAVSSTSLARTDEPNKLSENSCDRNFTSHHITGNVVPQNSHSLGRNKGMFDSRDQEKRSLTWKRQDGRERIYEESKQSEGKFALFKAAFLKKDSKKHTELERKRPDEIPNAPSRASLSNGTLNGMNEGRISATLSRQKSDTNSSKVSGSTSDIKRSHSSSSIQNKTDLALRRTVSLHKNGAASQLPRNAQNEKSVLGNLQKVPYSTSSLGRKKPVPESTF
ncbi:ubiquitin carboxyl-terminal hydrolase 43 [Protopterus annectens]|uniref:ubiquitin carboxyl-terminal hydrolase 43 n=1 Tax=Protopterus annectens TaxID=7888 RepID=UPI001CFAA8E8|nr:ubiquitin carboxyl-terminal hydrolase 43 [Protopterus annectens]